MYRKHVFPEDMRTKPWYNIIVGKIKIKIIVIKKFVNSWNIWYIKKVRRQR